VIFAQMVDDPSAHPGHLPDREEAGEGAAAAVPHHRGTGEVGEHHQRDRAAAGARRNLAELALHLRRECRPSTRAKELFDRYKLPAFHDPFAGGGALPLEAQRLGLESYASDLNPVAVLINKAMIEIPPKFAGKPPVNPDGQRQKAQMELARRAGPGRGRALLRPVDA
jgi:putative DNA methylase